MSIASNPALSYIDFVNQRGDGPVAQKNNSALSMKNLNTLITAAKEKNSVVVSACGNFYTIYKSESIVATILLSVLNFFIRLFTGAVFVNQQKGFKNFFNRIPNEIAFPKIFNAAAKLDPAYKENLTKIRDHLPDITSLINEKGFEKGQEIIDNLKKMLEQLGRLENLPENASRASIQNLLDGQLFAPQPPNPVAQAELFANILGLAPVGSVMVAQEAPYTAAAAPVSVAIAPSPLPVLPLPAFLESRDNLHERDQQALDKFLAKPPEKIGGYFGNDIYTATSRANQLGQSISTCEQMMGIATGDRVTTKTKDKICHAVMGHLANFLTGVSAKLKTVSQKEKAVLEKLLSKANYFFKMAGQLREPIQPRINTHS